MQAPVRTDFGEKIGGARKDIRGNVTRDDILHMTPEERLKLIRKDVVWPTPDYVKMVEQDGYTQKAAAMVKMLRDCFPACPTFSPTATEDQKAKGAELYAGLLNAAKSVTLRGKTDVDLAKAFRDAPEAKEFLFDIGEQPDPLATSRIIISPSKRFGEAVESAFRGDMNDSLVMRGGMRLFAEGALDFYTIKLLRRNKEWPRGTSLAEGWLRKNKVSVVQHGEGWALARNERVPPSATTYEGSSLARDGFTAMVGRTYPTKEEADTEMRNVAEAHFEAKRAVSKEKRDKVIARALGKTVGEPEPIVGRVGKDQRDGADATGDDYLETFGLRGGEYGLWVNQEERQDVTNKGFDSFCDIADVFGLPYSAVSLGGTLAIAFGARGRGGWAAATYEAGRRVINLTKPSGEGCLSHEWGHALDHHLGTRAQTLGLVDKVRDMEHSVYLTNVTLKPSQQGESEEAQYIRRFHQAMDSIWENRSPKTKEEVLGEAERRREIAVRNFAITVSNARASLNHRPGAEALIAAFNAHAELIRKPEAGNVIESYDKAVNGILSMPEFKATCAVKMDLVNYHSRAVVAVRDQEQRAILPPDWRGDSAPRKTSYTKACARLDKERSKPYYGLPHEMFARTIEAVVTDSLKERGHCNYFLVAGANGEAYPEEFERRDLKVKFGGLISGLQPHLPAVSMRQIARAPVARPLLPEPQAASGPSRQLDLI